MVKKDVAQPADVDMMGASTQQRRETQMSPHHTLAAEITKLRSGYILDLVMIDTQLGCRHTIARDIRVSGKREARQIAKQYDATPWNF
jgi:hypothetical protein